MISILSEKLNQIKNLRNFVDEDLSSQITDETSCIALWGNENYDFSHNNFPIVRFVETPIFGFGDESVPYGLSFSYQSDIYYSNKVNFLSSLLDSEWTPNEEDISTAYNCIEIINKYYISKFNQYPFFNKKVEDNAVLLIDQPLESESFLASGKTKDIFNTMFLHAFEKFSKSKIYIKLHPKTINNHSQGYLNNIILNNNLSNHPAICIVNENFNAPSIINSFDNIFVATSHMGFEAILKNKNVTCFADNFYSGYGFTEDIDLIKKSNRNPIDIFIALFLNQSIYINPHNNKKCDFLKLLEYISLRVRHKPLENPIFFRATTQPNKLNVSILGLSEDKSMEKNIINKSDLIYKKEHLIISDSKTSLDYLGKQFKTSFYYSGFLFDFLKQNQYKGSSAIVDRLGCFYDYSSNNSLNSILNEEVFTQHEINQSKDLIKLILESFSKYSVKENTKKTILIPAVSDDNFYQNNGNISSETELILNVAEKEKNSIIIYFQTSNIKFKNSLQLINHLSPKLKQSLLSNNNELIIRNPNDNFEETLFYADEIHTLNHPSAILGLILNKKITVYGQSFLSGRGLTTDLVRNNLATRQLTLEEFIASCYILYPRYKINSSPYYVSPIDCIIFSKTIQPKKQNFLEKLINLIK